MATMIEVGLGLLAALPQAAERIDFSLEPGVVLFAILFFVLVNLLLAAVLYPYLKNTSGEDAASGREEAREEDLVEEAPAEGEPLNERVDDFLKEIEEGG